MNYKKLKEKLFVIYFLAFIVLFVVLIFSYIKKDAYKVIIDCNDSRAELYITTDMSWECK